jgi:hypothetical protein
VAARYWKNNKQINLTDGAGQNGLAHAIVVHGNDVYVAGTEGPTAKYWLNGNAVNLPGGSTSSGSIDMVSCMAVSKR